MIARDFFPGSEWLYFKVYCGYKSAEKILANEIHNFVLDYSDYYLKFFFIRYGDDLPHFRIRFFNEDLSKQMTLQIKFLKILEPLIQNKAIHRIAIDTYKRELNRYNENLIIQTESIFYHDSVASLKMLNLLSQIENSEKYRLLMSMRSIDMFLSDFQLLTIEKLDFLRIIQHSFFIEFGGQDILKKQLNSKYKTLQRTIFSHMDASMDEENGIVEAIEIYNERSKKNALEIYEIKNKLHDNDDRFNVLSSYIHMHMNRHFVSQNRKYELLVYHFMERYYTSQIAINKSKAK